MLNTTDFPVADEQAWRALVAKTLKDAPFEKLQSRTVEGLQIEPLYSARDAARFPVRPFDAERPWDVRTVVTQPDTAKANAEILADLTGGAASIVVAIDPTGAEGVAVGSADTLGRVLEHVVLEMAPVALDAGFLGPRAADWLGTCAKASPGAKLVFNLDPVSAFAEVGFSPGPVESHVVSAATVAARLADTYPLAKLFQGSGRVVHEAGGGEALEVAFAVANALAYAKALVRAGLPVAQAFKGVTLGLAVDCDYLVSVAKLRAARAVYARVAIACGADPAAVIEARSSRRMLTAQDAWTNMIRLTAAGFAGAVGGADAVALGQFSDAIGRPTDFARRQSRNTQFVLMEEAHIGRVADPAAGSGYLETLTDQIARAAWDDFQAIEAQGGIIAALASGHVAAKVEAARTARTEPKIVGVTAFPPTAEAPIEVDSTAPAPVESPTSRLPGPDGACPALTPTRLSQAYEVTA